MDIVLSNIHIKVNDKLYLKDPDSSELGRKIISGSIQLIHQIGFDHFTFQKLGKKIKSTEASIYRYFESKHKLLLYLLNWYWSYIEYRLIMNLSNINDPWKKLEKSLITICNKVDAKFDNMNVGILGEIVGVESSKAYLIKEVDKVNKDGAYLGYKRVVELIASIIKEIQPKYKYPNMLVSTIIEGMHHQKFFADHLPRLTNTHKSKNTIYEFNWELLKSCLKK